MSPKITQIQDKFFKSIFSRKEIAIELFEKTLTQNIQTIIDIEKIELVSGSFVSGKLKEYFADLVYRCPLFEDGEVQIVLLLEHKSYQEDYPHFQLLQYFLNLWKQNTKQKQAPTFIIPIIFYHGKTTWHYQRMQDYFAQTPKQLLHYLPIFDYNLIDLSTMEDSQIEGFKNSFLAVSAFLLKYHHLKNYIKLKEDAFVKLMKKIDIEQDTELSESIFVYVQETNSLTKKRTF